MLTCCCQSYIPWIDCQPNGPSRQECQKRTWQKSRDAKRRRKESGKSAAERWMARPRSGEEQLPPFQLDPSSNLSSKDLSLKWAEKKVGPGHKSLPLSLFSEDLFPWSSSFC